MAVGRERRETVARMRAVTMRTTARVTVCNAGDIRARACAKVIRGGQQNFLRVSSGITSKVVISLQASSSEG